MTRNNSSLDRTLPQTLSTRQTVVIIGLAGITTFLLLTISLFAPLNYAFRLLITMVHELGHGIAALLTGGEFVRFVVYPNGAGLAYTAGGWRLFVIPAGYLSVALFGAGLIMVGRNHRWSRLTMALMGILMAFFALRYGLPSIFSNDLFSGALTTMSGFFFGGIFLLVAVRASDWWIIFLLHVVAIQAGLTAFSDLMTLIGLSSTVFSPQRTDAQSMAELTFIPAIVWAVLWAGVAVVIIGAAIWITWRPGVSKPPTRLRL